MMSTRMFRVTFTRISRMDGKSDTFKCTIRDFEHEVTVTKSDPNPCRAFWGALDKHPEGTLGFLQAADPADWDTYCDE